MANTTKTIAEGKKVSDLELNAEIKAAAQLLADEVKVKVSIPKSYGVTCGWFDSRNSYSFRRSLKRILE
jgi:hypothetical protein